MTDYSGTTLPGGSSPSRDGAGSGLVARNGPIPRSALALRMSLLGWSLVLLICCLFFIGFAMKILLANPVGKIADAVFAAPSPGAADAWWGALAYAFQIYFDFSGYSDMAIGLGLMLGFVFPKNFDSPYKSGSITEFWHRWHISLSTWLRDYLYVPLGGNRKGPARTYVNLFLVMLIGGLWHGAAWNFLVWGALHGGWLALERLRGGRPIYAGLPAPLRTAATFVLVLVSWVFFRAPDFVIYLKASMPTLKRRIAQAVTDEVERQGPEKDHQPREGRCPPSPGDDVGLAFGDQSAPLRLTRDRQADEGECGSEEDGVAHVERCPNCRHGSGASGLGRLSARQSLC